MTSAADFHLVSWRNFFLLSAVVVGVLIPVGMRYYFKREIALVADVEQGELEEEFIEENEDHTLAVGPRAQVKKSRAARLVELSDEETEVYSEDEDEDDVILEAGPAIVIKGPEELATQFDSRRNMDFL
jgi:hypothetical protein